MFGLNNFKIFPNNNARIGLDTFFIKEHFIDVNVTLDGHILNQFCQTKISLQLRLQWIFTKLSIFIDKHITHTGVKSYKCMAYNKEDIWEGICVTLTVHMYCATESDLICHLVTLFRARNNFWMVAGCVDQPNQF